MNKWALALGPEVMRTFTKGVAIAQEKKVVEGRKMRVDTTVVETTSTIRPTAVCWAMECAS